MFSHVKCEASKSAFMSDTHFMFPAYSLHDSLLGWNRARFTARFPKEGRSRAPYSRVTRSLSDATLFTTKCGGEGTVMGVTMSYEGA